jgi:hypothetical protein
MIVPLLQLVIHGANFVHTSPRSYLIEKTRVILPYGASSCHRRRSLAVKVKNTSWQRWITTPAQNGFYVPTVLRFLKYRKLLGLVFLLLPRDQDTFATPGTPRALSRPISRYFTTSCTRRAGSGTTQQSGNSAYPRKSRRVRSQFRFLSGSLLFMIHTIGCMVR